MKKNAYNLIVINRNLLLSKNRKIGKKNEDTISCNLIIV